MSPRFSFETAALRSVSAHGGRGKVLTCRARRGTAVTSHNFLDLTVVPAGASIGRHTHDLDNEETYVVVSGRGSMEADGEAFDVGAGDVVVNPPGGTHALTNTGAEPLRIVVFEVKVAPGDVD